MHETKFEEIQRKSTRGIKWQGFSEILTRIFQFGVTIILARLLMPQDFGLIGVALIFTQLAFAVFDLGFSAALIQKKEIEQKHISTTFVVNILSASFFALLVFSLSTTIAGYFEQPELENILKVLSVIFFFYAFSAVPRILLTRSMRFKRISGLQVVSALVYSFSVLGLAMRGFGVWSFVYASLLEQFTLTILLNIFSFGKVSWKFDPAAFKELVVFGGKVLGSRVSAYFNNNIPNFVIGKWLGTVQLGYFSIAYQLTEFPVQRISKNILNVMFPAFSKLQDDIQEYKALFLKIVYYLSLIVLPIFVGLILIAPNFIIMVYGAKWQSAVIPVQLLSLMGLLRSFWILNSLVFLSKGQPEIEFKINIGYAIIAIPALIYASSFSLNIVVISIVGLLFCFYIIGLYRALRLIEISFLTFLAALKIPFFSVMAIVSFHFSILASQLTGLEKIWQLLFTIISAVAIYIIVVMIFDRKIITKFKQLIRS